VHHVSMCTGVVALSGIEAGALAGKHTGHDKEVATTVWAVQRGRRAGVRGCGLTRSVAFQGDHLSDGVGRDGTARMQKAEVSDCHHAIGQDVLEEPAETLHGVEVESAWACTVGCAVGASDGTVFESHHAALGDCHVADRRGEVCERRVAVGVGLAVDVPGESPDLWVALLSQSGLAQVCFAESPGDGGEGLHGDKDVGSRGEPLVTVCGKTATRNDGMNVRVVLERSSPGVQDTGKAGQGRADAALLVSEPFAGSCGRLAQDLGGDVLMRAEKRAQGLRDGAGKEKVGARELCLQVVVEPLLGCMLLALWTVPVAACVIDAVLVATGVARREALSVMATWALLDGADDLTVRGGEGGRALQRLWRQGVDDVADGGHGRSPCMRALMRT
jgi:hypothetical protein